MRETASESSNHRIKYVIHVNGSGTNRGSAMANTILDGSGNYQTRQVVS